MILSKVVAEGNQLDSLIALRDFVAEELEKGDEFCTKCRRSPSVAALAKQLAEILERIALIKPSEKTKVDARAEQRAERRERDLRASSAQDIVVAPSADIGGN